MVKPKRNIRFIQQMSKNVSTCKEFFLITGIITGDTSNRILDSFVANFGCFSSIIAFSCSNQFQSVPISSLTLVRIDRLTLWKPKTANFILRHLNTKPIFLRCMRVWFNWHSIFMFQLCLSIHVVGRLCVLFRQELYHILNDAVG